MIRPKPMSVTFTVAAVLLAGLGVLRVMDREGSPVSAPDAVRCRDATDPTLLRELPKEVTQALSADGSSLRGVELGVPSLRDATWAAGEIGASHALAICGGSAPRSLYVLLQEDEPIERCYGPSSSCPESETVRVTCYVGLDGRTERVTHPQSCLDPVRA